MNRIIINEENKDTIIEFTKESYRGCSFYHDGRIDNLSLDISHLFREFFLSSDNTILKNCGKYQVILDNKTGFKHYFWHNQEDFQMFFQNNGEDAIQFLDNNRHRRRGKLSTKEKLFRVGKKVIRCTCTGLLCIMFAISTLNAIAILKYPQRVTSFRTIPMVEWIFGKQDITSAELIKKIYGSSRLSDEDKAFLANKDYLEDILPYVNSSNAAKLLYREKFCNIGVKEFDNEDKAYAGYYMSIDCNSLYIAKQYQNTSFYNDVLSHEYVHLSQSFCYYNVIAEACAEIISEEYFIGARAQSYPDEVYLVKKLMEIIGPEPILEYNFTGNFQKIADGVKPYLTSKEYDTFLDSLKTPNVTSDDYDETINKSKLSDCNQLLDKVYEKKFGCSIMEDPVIPHLHDYSLVRYYFNKCKNNEGSYITISKKTRLWYCSSLSIYRRL